jgi:hypothetical protein
MELVVFSVFGQLQIKEVLTCFFFLNKYNMGPKGTRSATVFNIYFIVSFGGTDNNGPF